MIKYRKEFNLHLNDADYQYCKILDKILYQGYSKDDRTGTGTISLFGEQVRYNLLEQFPILSQKKMHLKSIIHELLWFLKGETNVKYLLNNNVNIWNGDLYKKYCKSLEGARGIPLKMKDFINKLKSDDNFLNEYGDLGNIYGKQWTAWESKNGYTINQIDKVIEQLKVNPDSRRIIVNAWNVGELEEMYLPPCHNMFQLYSRKATSKELKKFIDTYGYNRDEKELPKRVLSLKFSMRSNDYFLGNPFNIASYSLLLQMIAQQVNMIPFEVIGCLGDTHLYNNHIEYVNEFLLRSSKCSSPIIKINKQPSIYDYTFEDFTLLDYDSHPNWKNVPLSN